MEIGMVNSQSSGFFSNTPFESKPVLAIQDSDFHSDDRSESYRCGNGLCTNDILWGGYD